MKGKRYTLVRILLAVMLAICSLCFISCKPKGGEDSSSVSFGETGSYYFNAIDEEYELTLEDGRYSLTIEGVLMEGTYSYDGAILNLYAANEGGANILGSIEGTILTITYNGGTYNFYKKVDYTVTFDVDGGSAISAVTVTNGKTVTKPADPTKDGCYFIGWYADKAFTTPFAFDSNIITSDTTIYARFVTQSVTDNEYTATLFVDGEKLESRTTIGGVLYGLPTPQSADKTFAGWWVSDAQEADKLTYKYTEQQLTQNVNLYAVWANDGLQLSVNENGASWAAIRVGVEYTVSIEKGDDIVYGPYKTTDLSINYDFSAAIAGEYKVTVKAEDKTSVAYYWNKALSRVSIFSVTEPSTLVFVGVENAEKYLITVKCGNEDHAHTQTHTAYDNGSSTTYTFHNCEMKDGGVEFVVTAVAEGYLSSTSDTPFSYARQLNSVSGVSFDEATGILSWNAADVVENYAELTVYNVTITSNGKTDTYELKETSLSLTKYTGDLSVTINAVNPRYNGAAATEFTCAINKLPSPVLKVVGEKVVWTAVEGASSYLVSLNVKDNKGNEVATTETSVTGTEFTLPEEHFKKGYTFTITVKSISSDATKNSYSSDPIVAKCGEVSNIQYYANTLTWDAVIGADEYRYQVADGGSSQVKVGDATSASIASFKKAGEIKITVSAYANGKSIGSNNIMVSTYEVAFDVQGGTAVSPTYGAIGDKIPFPEETSTKAYHTFGGWYNTPSGPEGNGMEYNETSTVTGAMTIFAYWEPNSYEVTLMVGETVYNEATGAYEYKLVEYGTATVLYGRRYTLPIPETEDKLKLFYGWYAGDSLDSTRYTDENGNSIFNWSLTEGTELVAQWRQVLEYELMTGAGGKYWQITESPIAQLATEITVPAYYTDPLTKNTYPVKAIATGAFRGCTALQVLNIPDTLETIFIALGSTQSNASTGSALFQCFGLREINVYCIDEDGVHDEHSTHETYFHSENGILIRHSSPNMEVLDNGVELYFIPNSIQMDVFRVPDGVQHIPSRTFYHLNFSKVIIPHTVTRLGDRAFYRCETEELIFEEAPKGVEEKTLTITEGVFNAMPRLTEIYLPTRIGDLDFFEWNLFTDNPKLVKIHIVGDPTPEQEATNSYYTSNDGVVCSHDGKELVFAPKYLKGTYTVPVEIQVIGERAFYDCAYFTELIIKDNVKTIKSEAFLDCLELKTVTFEYERGSLDIESKAFYNCVNLSSIEFPRQLTHIGSHAFGSTPKLQTVTITGSKDAMLDEKVFADTSSKNIGYVTTVHLTSGAPNFEVNSVFFGCTLYILDIDKGNENFHVDEQGVLYDSDKTKILYYPFGLEGDYVIPYNTITTIGKSVFENRPNIKSIEIPASVTLIEEKAFKNCVGLQTLTFAPRTTDLTIVEGAFEHCVALTSVSLPENMTTLRSGVFKDCISLKSVHVPSTLTGFTLDAFSGCENIGTITVANSNEKFGVVDGILYGKDGNDLVSLLFVPEALTGSVEIPSTVTSISDGAFMGKSKITSISFANNTASDELVLGKSVFANMDSLTSVRFPNGLKTIPLNALNGSAVTSIYVPNSVTKVMPGAFANCKKLKTVTFEDGSEDLEFAEASSATNAFYNTTSLTSITLPNRMKKIGMYMFANTSLVEINFPNNLTEIGEGAFANAKKLKNVVIPNTVTAIGELTFTGCIALESVTLSNQLEKIPNYMFGFVKEEEVPNVGTHEGSKPTGPSTERAIKTPKYRSVNGYQSNTVGLMESTAACTSLTSITIPASVKYLEKFAFRGCSALTTITFKSNEGLQTIGEGAFMSSGITAFDMPDSVGVIGGYSFAGCKDLETLTISEKVLSIPVGMCGERYEYMGSNGETGVEQLQPCSSLTSIVIHEGIRKINANAFRGTTSLTSVTFEGDPELSEIGASAFEDSAIKVLDLSKATATEITIGDFAFRNAGLENVNLPFAVQKTLKENSLGTAFLGCDYIKTFEMATEDGTIDGFSSLNVEAESLVVYNWNKTEIRLYVGNAEEFTIPEGVTKIHHNAFRGNTTLKSVTLPASLLYIDDAAFAFCAKLETVNIPANTNLRAIGYRAFAFSGLTSIELPASLTSLGAHSYNLGLPSDAELAAYTEWFVGEGLGRMSNPAIDAKNNMGIPSGWNLGISSQDKVGRVFESCPNLTTVVVNTNVTCERLFEYCTKLENVTFGDNVTVLSNYMFSWNKSLKTIELPANLTNPGQWTFYRAGLTSVVIPASTQLDYSTDATAMGYGMFAECANLKSVKFNGSFSNIPSSFLDGATGLEEITLPNGLIHIGSSAFYGCTALKTINFPANMSRLVVESNAFYNMINWEVDLDFSKINFRFGSNDNAMSVFKGCAKLKSIKLPNSVGIIPDSTFYGCESLETVDANNLTHIGGRSFAHCYKLKGLTLAQDAQKIGLSAFENCYSLKEFVVPDSVTEFGPYSGCVFKNSGLESITIGAGVKEIGPMTFLGTNLKRVYIPATVKEIEATAFMGCSELEAFEVDPANKNFYVGDFGELYTSTGCLMFFPGSSHGEDGEFVMPRGTTLNMYAFYRTKYITSVTLSAAVSVIPTGAFQESALTTIKFTENVTRIGAFAFKDCQNLVTIQLPNSIVDPIPEEVPEHHYQIVTEFLGTGYIENAAIGESAFEGCTALTTVNIPEYATRIADRAFRGCISLKTIQLPEGLKFIGDEVFEESGLVEIVIPASVEQLGEKKVEKIDISGLIFENCTSLKSVVFEGSNINVMPELFKGCTALESVTLAEGTKTISAGMFSGCTLLNIELPSSIESIGADAFYGWTGRQTITIDMTMEEANALWGQGWNGNAKVLVKGAPQDR